ncbi:MAG: PepSY domain-containing protein [Pseudomonadota bacterium]
MMSKTLLVPLFAGFGLALVSAPASAVQSSNEQNAARAQMLAGKVQSIRSIENRVLPKMSGSQYIGPEYDAASQVYRLKFIREGRVIFVDVDARTGSILRQRR